MAKLVEKKSERRQQRLEPLSSATRNVVKDLNNCVSGLTGSPTKLPAPRSAGSTFTKRPEQRTVVMSSDTISNSIIANEQHATVVRLDVRVLHTTGAVTQRAMHSAIEAQVQLARSLGEWHMISHTVSRSKWPSSIGRDGVVEPQERTESIIAVVATRAESSSGAACRADNLLRSWTRAVDATFGGCKEHEERLQRRVWTRRGSGGHVWVDCRAVRDRSWEQTKERAEREAASNGSMLVSSSTRPLLPE